MLERRAVKVACAVLRGGKCRKAPTYPEQATAYSLCSVRRESGMEECGNTLAVQAPSEPLELSIIDHSMV